MAKVKCRYSGAVYGTTESARLVRCSCGHVAGVTPKQDRISGGQVVPGWSVRMPSHAEVT